MKFLRILLTAVILTTQTLTPALADELSELKKMVEDMRADYESKIQILENKISQLENTQNQQLNTKVAQVREEIKQEIKNESWKTQYVGRDHDHGIGKGGFELQSPAGMAKVTVGGYMDHEFENFQNTNSTFDQHRWILTIGAQLGERLRFFGEYEIEHGGPNASGSGEAKVEASYIDFLINDMVNLRAGAIIVPFGRLNIEHDSDLRDLTSRPLVNRDIIPTTWTESGAGFFGEFEPILGSYEDLLVNYEIYAVNGLDDGFSDTGLRGARGSLSSDNNNNKAVVARLGLSPAIGHEIGFSGYFGKYNSLGDSLSGKSIDILSTWGPLEIKGEYAFFKANIPDFADSGLRDIAEEFKGYFIQANYHFWFDFLDDTFLGRRFEDPTFTLVTRYGSIKIDDDADASTGDNEEDRFTLGLNYRPIESMVFKIEHQWNDTENEALERGNNNGWFASMALGF